MTKSGNSPFLDIGNDILEIERVRHCIEEYGTRFLDRIFTKKEQSYCLAFRDAAPHFAGRFCAKEAIVKALGTGIGKVVGWQDLEILNDPQGKPHVFLSEKALQHFNHPRILISISHCKKYVSTVALLIGVKKEKREADTGS